MLCKQIILLNNIIVSWGFVGKNILMNYHDDDWIISKLEIESSLAT